MTTERDGFPRPLTETERAVAWHIMEKAGVAELDVLRGQLDAAIAAAPCTCPCPTIDLEVDPSRAAPTSYSGRPIADADYDGGGIMVWVDDGWLSNLEIYWWTDEPPLEFPALEALSNFRAY